MATITKVVCDSCGAEKGEVNHWWCLATYMESHKDIAIGIFPFGFDFDRADEIGFEHVADVCGQSCAIDCVSRFLSTGRIERASATPVPIPADEDCQF